MWWAIVMVVAACAPQPSEPVTPQTVPALRSWTPNNGAFRINPNSRIVAEPALVGDAQVFSDDVAALTGHVIPIATEARHGDIVLRLGDSDRNDGYTLTIGSMLVIEGSSPAGVFYGTRSVLQLLAQSPEIPGGTARDFPTKPERGLMIDVGRKHVSIAWLEERIRELAYFKLDHLHLHLSDSQGFRLESELHPEIVSAAHYTKKQIRELVAFAARYHVTLVPEIDMPAHMDAILAAHPELQLGEPFFLDIRNPAALPFVRELIEEFMPLFPGPYWHIGGDEYSPAVAKDAFYQFIIELNAIVNAGGKTMRMWNDGIRAEGTIRPPADIVVDYWFDYGLTPQELVDRGHTIANQSWDPTYYVAGGVRANPEWVYEAWQPDVFQNGLTIDDATANLGSFVHVWCDNPNAETEAEIAAGIHDLLRVVAQQTWGSPKPVASFAEWLQLANAVESRE